MKDYSDNEKALRRAVIANPDDDTARLVFADCIQENAEMIRCKRCYGTGKRDPAEHYTTVVRYKPKPGSRCRACGGSGVLPDGREQYAEFIRSQVDAAKGVKLESLKLWHLLQHSDNWYPDACGALGLPVHCWAVCYDERVEYEYKSGTPRFVVSRGFISTVVVDDISRVFTPDFCATRLARYFVSEHPVTRFVCRNFCPQTTAGEDDSHIFQIATGDIPDVIFDKIISMNVSPHIIVRERSHSLMRFGTCEEAVDAVALAVGKLARESEGFE